MSELHGRWAGKPVKVGEITTVDGEDLVRRFYFLGGLVGWEGGPRRYVIHENMASKEFFIRGNYVIAKTVGLHAPWVSLSTECVWSAIQHAGGIKNTYQKTVKEL